MMWGRSLALPLAGATSLALALGWGLTLNQQLSLLALVALLGVLASASPASAWVGAALVAALTFKGLATLGVLPSVATFVDLPLAWGALFVALIKGNEQTAFLRRHLQWLSALAVAVALAWAFNPSEFLRPVLYFMLLGEPFAIVGALIADPPSRRARLILERMLLALVVIQIPLCALQLLWIGPSDKVQGTLYGAAAGAHVTSAVVVVGAIWILSRVSTRQMHAWWLIVVPLLFLIPFVADAKQVIVALPAIVLASSWRVGRGQLLVRSVLAVGSVVALFTLVPAGDAAERFITTGREDGGKGAVAHFIWQRMGYDPASVAFGIGPAETVSRAAFMTVYSPETGSPLASLGLRPAEIAVEAQGVALGGSYAKWTDTSSFNTGVSSTVGVLGDLGILGLVVYMGLLLSLFQRLRTESSPEAVAAAAGFALFFVLGLVFDWWEQPPFGVCLGVLAGLALSKGAPVIPPHPAWSKNTLAKGAI